MELVSGWSRTLQESNESLSRALGWLGLATIVIIWLPFLAAYFTGLPETSLLGDLAPIVHATASKWLKLVLFEKLFVVWMAVPIICFVENAILVGSPRFLPWRPLKSQLESTEG